MCSPIILLHQESSIMAVSDAKMRVVLNGGRSYGKAARMQREMFNTKERIAIVTKDGVRYSEWADAEEIK